MLEDFWLPKEQSLELKPQKTKRILVYPNFTSANYETDSYVDALSMMIKNLNENRDDLFFYIISPKDVEIKALKFHNTHQFCVLDIPTHPPTMRVHFDVNALAPVYKFLDYDYDFIFSHLPEHTTNLINMLSYKTHFEPEVFGYSHWFDFPNVANWKDVFLIELGNLLQMKKCFVNTSAQKKLVIEHAKEIFSPEIASKIESVLDVGYLGIKEEDIARTINKKTEKIIVFNHRPWAYKDYPNFLKIMDKLYEQRQDFRVWVPLVKKADRPYMFNDKFDKKGYYKFLRDCRVGFGPKQLYAGWSIAVTDGLMNGCPYIMYDAPYNAEINRAGDFFKNNDEAIKLLNTYLDDNDYRNWQAKNALNHSVHNLVYNAHNISNNINHIHAAAPRVQSDDKIKEMKELIKKRGQISKKDLIKELGWGVSIKWNKYRNALLDDPNIFDSNTKNPVYTYVD